jgi:hypothetical protein
VSNKGLHYVEIDEDEAESLYLGGASLVELGERYSVSSFYRA